MRAAKPIAMALVVAICTTGAVYARGSELSEAKAAKAEAETALSETEERISELEDRKEALQSEIDELDAELVPVMVDLSVAKNDVSAKQAEIDATSVSLDSARDERDKMYEAMKTRIRFMYESGDAGLLDSLISSESYADVLIKISMYQEIYESDREELDKYTAKVKEIQELVDSLSEEQSELVEIQEGLEETEAEYEALIEEREAEIEDADALISAAEALAEEYEAVIEEQNKLIAEHVIDGYEVDGSEEQIAVIQYALQFVGNKYVWGGTSLTNGCDCSGFVQSVYKHFGKSLPRTSGAQASAGYAVSTPRTGDIICYSGHVALYIGGGKIVHASNSKPYPAGGIKVSNNYRYRTIVAIRRVF